MRTSFYVIVSIVALVAMSFVNINMPDSVTDSYWVRFCDENSDCGYLNAKGDTMIPAGKYAICYTDTFRSYAIVLKTGDGYIGINKAEKLLYNVFTFDNGPDPVSEGRFRIIRNGLIGFADERTGKIMIYPQYKCAFPYENAVAEVSYNCEINVKSGDEHTTWTGGQWFYIDHAGKKTAPPEH